MMEKNIYIIVFILINPALSELRKFDIGIRQNFRQMLDHVRIAGIDKTDQKSLYNGTFLFLPPRELGRFIESHGAAFTNASIYGCINY